MEIPWHDYTNADSNALIANADLIEKASVIGRVGLIMLSCGTGAWRVRTSMNKLIQGTWSNLYRGCWPYVY